MLSRYTELDVEPGKGYRLVAGAWCASLALAALPLIFSYKSEKSLCGTGAPAWPTVSGSAPRRKGLSSTAWSRRPLVLSSKPTVASSHLSLHTNRYRVFGRRSHGEANGGAGRPGDRAASAVCDVQTRPDLR